MKQLPKNQKPVRSQRSKNGLYVTRYYILVDTEREARLRLFQAKLKALCDQLGVDLTDGETCAIEVRERGFKYPPGFSYSAVMYNQRRIHIERTWFDEVDVPEKQV